MGEIGEVSFFEFLIPSFRDMPIQQQHMYAQLVVDEFWVDMHISKASYQLYLRTKKRKSGRLSP
jgi:hypothetical protein